MRLEAYRGLHLIDCCDGKSSPSLRPAVIHYPIFKLTCMSHRGTWEARSNIRSLERKQLPETDGRYIHILKSANTRDELHENIRSMAIHTSSQLQECFWEAPTYHIPPNWSGTQPSAKEVRLEFCEKVDGYNFASSY